MKKGTLFICMFVLCLVCLAFGFALQSSYFFVVACVIPFVYVWKINKIK